jgi:hypothetical protein
LLGPQVSAKLEPFRLEMPYVGHHELCVLLEGNAQRTTGNLSRRSFPGARAAPIHANAWMQVLDFREFILVGQRFPKVLDTRRIVSLLDGTKPH